MGSIVKLFALAIVAVLAAVAANFARDLAYQVNALTVMLVAAGFFVYTLRTMGQPAAPATGYQDDVVRAGVIATAFWGMAGFLVGVVIAFQLAFPELNLGFSFTSFGRLRPFGLRLGRPRRRSGIFGEFENLHGDPLGSSFAKAVLCPCPAYSARARVSSIPFFFF